MSWVQRRVGEDGTVRYTATYRDPAGRGRSAGTFTSRREAECAGRRAESRVEDGSWLDRSAGRISFYDYVEQVRWPSRHLEVSTRAGYRANLDKHFLPHFGAMPMAELYRFCRAVRTRPAILVPDLMQSARRVALA